MAAAIAAGPALFGAGQALGAPVAEFRDPGPGALVHVDARNLSYDRSGTTVIATGDVVITYGDYLLNADRVTYNPKTEKIVATGNVKLTEPDGAVLTAHRLELGERFKEGFVDRVAVLLVNNARIRARSAERIEGGITRFSEVTYTACEECKEDPSRPVTWEIKADKITHNKPERTIEYENAQFNFLGVPLAYVPKFSHADPTVKRKSGFLVPGFNFSSVFGFGVEVPYFWNLAPNYDLTASPLITTKQGPVMNFTWRHRLANGGYSIKPNGVYELTRDNQRSGKSRWRGSIATKGNFRLAENWTWGWDGTLTSDDTYLRRYKFNSTTDLTSQIYLNGAHDRNYFDTRAYHFRGLLSTDRSSTTPYVLPIVDHSYYLQNPILGGEARIDSSFFHLSRTSGTDSTRAISAFNWERTFVSDLGTVVTPFANVRADIYAVDNVADPGVVTGVRNAETVARVLPTAGVEFRWPFVNLNASGRHVIEPVAQLLVRPSEYDARKIPNEDAQSFEFDETNLFAHNKFSGLDRWEGGIRANAGLNYTYRMNSGRYLKATVGQSYQIEGRNGFAAGSGLENDVSDYVGALFFQLNEHLLLTSRIRLDQDSLDIERNELGAQAKYGSFLLDASYADLDKAPALGRSVHSEEIRVQGSVDITERWTGFAGIRYDIKTDSRISNYVGLGYENECFGVRIHYRETFVEDRDVEQDRSLSLRFELKTIGGAGFSSGIN